MKAAFALLPALLLASGLTVAGPADDSAASAALSVVVAAVPVSVLAAPVLLVTSVVHKAVSESAKNHVEVQVDTKDGKETISLPKHVVDKANLKQGDKLSVKKTKSGALLSKNEVPLAYLVPPENAKLGHSHELAK